MRNPGLTVFSRPIKLESRAKWQAKEVNEQSMYGQLVPVGGGDPIPLLKKELLVGRRESCDIRLRFGNVSAHHCQLECDSGYWYATDLNSRNGIKVNGQRVQRKRLDPGDKFSIAKHHYEIEYDPTENGAVGPPPPEDAAEEIMGKSLLERAGLEGAYGSGAKRKRYNPDGDSGGRFKDPNEPV